MITSRRIITVTNIFLSHMSHTLNALNHGTIVGERVYVTSIPALRFEEIDYYLCLSPWKYMEYE